MTTKRTRRLAALAALPAGLLFAACSQQPATPASSTSVAASATPNSSFTGTATVPAPVAKALKVALVVRTAQGGWLEDYTRTVRTEVTALGGSLQIFDAKNDLATMATDVTTAVTAGADLLLIDNGTAAALNKPVQAALDKKIPVVAYDSDLTLPGVASIKQDDAALATQSIAAIDKDFNGKATIVVISVAGYPPLDHRLAAVKAYVAAHPGITVLTQTGTVSGNSSLDTQAQIEALLKAHPGTGAINAIWTDWNDFSVGAALALKSQHRSDVKLYTVDLTDQNLPYFWDPAAQLQAVSASNPETIAISQVRLAYRKAAGEIVSDLTVEPVLVTRSGLPATVLPYAQLSSVVPGWSKDAVTWPAWIQTLETEHK